jgi:hypothetical protein
VALDQARGGVAGSIAAAVLVLVVSRATPADPRPAHDRAPRLTPA